jgi:hypothetical protein
MPEKLNWSLTIQVAGGPGEGASQSLDVEAYDVITVTVPGGDTTTPGTATVQVQPGGSGQVAFLLVKSSLYDGNLTYAVDGGSAVKLDALHLFMGTGAVGLLGTTQNAFVFTNTVAVDKPAAVEILVGRKATA